MLIFLHLKFRKTKLNELTPQAGADGFGEGSENVKIAIEGTPNEIASLVLELQERQSDEDATVLANRFQRSLDKQLGAIAYQAKLHRIGEKLINENWEPVAQTKLRQLFGTDLLCADTDGCRPGSSAAVHRATPGQVHRRIYSGCQRRKEDP